MFFWGRGGGQGNCTQACQAKQVQRLRHKRSDAFSLRKTARVVVRLGRLFKFLRVIAGHTKNTCAGKSEFNLFASKARSKICFLELLIAFFAKVASLIARAHASRNPG